MNYYELELKNKTLKLRLTSSNAVALEKKVNVKLLDYIRDYAMNTIITLIRYLLMWETPNISQDSACEIYDELINEGYTLEKILYDVIYEGLVASGFLTKEELEKMKQDVLTAQKKTTDPTQK